MKERKPITVVVSTREINVGFKTSLFEAFGEEDLNILLIENKGKLSLSTLYNDVIENLTESKISDIVVFCHDDIVFDSNDIGKKIRKHFYLNPKYSIIGVAGTTNLISGTWWEDKTSMKGIVNHSEGMKKWTSKYSEDLGSNLTEVIAIDGVFMATKLAEIEYFNEDVSPGFHFYDLGFSVDNILNGKKIAVCYDIRLTHLSVGKVNDSWENNKKLFENEYKEVLPLNNFNKTNNSKISVIMASYLDEYTDGKHKSATNREYKFERAVDSFINQSYKNSELIIVSDGCEKTNKIYNEKYSSYNNIKLISLDKQPLFSGNVRQAGIKSATGDLICYLDSDDIFDPEHLSTIDKCVTKQHQWFFYNDYLYDGKQKQMRDVIPQFSRIGTSSFCHKKSLNVKWVDGYNHDWKTIESIIKKPHLKISTPGYLVCHQQAYNLDY